MTQKTITPKDILSDEQNHAEINGVNVRKGTVAAFIANITLLESLNHDSIEQKSILNMLQELAPAVVAIGLHQHVIFKNPVIEKILQEAAEKIK